MHGKTLLLSVIDAVSSLDGASPRVANIVAGVVATVRAAAFWVAVLLPLAYLPLLAGISGSVEPEALLGLTTLHATTLVVGHVHDGVLGEVARG